MSVVEQTKTVNLLRLARTEWEQRGGISEDTKGSLRQIGVLVDDLEQRWWNGQ